MKYIILTIIVLFTSGCSIKNVKSWEKGTLAKDSMQSNLGSA